MKNVVKPLFSAVLCTFFALTFVESCMVQWIELGGIPQTLSHGYEGSFATFKFDEESIKKEDMQRFLPLVMTKNSSRFLNCISKPPDGPKVNVTLLRP